MSDEDVWQWDLRGWCQVCGFLQTSRRTIRRWAKGDNPPPVRRLPCGAIVANRAELRAWGKRAARPIAEAS